MPKLGRERRVADVPRSWKRIVFATRRAEGRRELIALRLVLSSNADSTMKDDDDREASSHPLLPTSGSSSSRGAQEDAYYPPSNPSSSTLYRSGGYLALLRRPLSKGWILVVLAALGFFVFSLSMRGESGSRRGSQVEGWKWSSRPKASEGLLKVGGRRARNESYTG